MDPSDPRYGSHPSQSIPDAAYPDDSPFRPSTAGVPYSSNIELQPLSTSTSPLTQHGSPSSQPHGSSSHINTASYGNNPPLDPPPPYEPARPAATYSPSPNLYQYPGDLRPHKLDPYAEAMRRRRKLRARIKGAAIGVVSGILILVIVGVVLAMLRNKLDLNND